MFQVSIRRMSACVLALVAALSVGMLGLPDEASAQTPEARQIPIVLTQGTNMAAAVAPDGESMVIAVQSALWTLPIEGGDATRISTWDMEATAPVWSPDGTRIAFQNFDEHYYQIWSVAADGREARALTSGYYDHREPAWSGSRIAFSSDRSGEGSYDIWTLDLDSSEYRRWTQSANDAHSPAWSPDGESIAYVDGDVIRSVNSQGQTTTLGTFSQGNRSVYAPAWLPDGSGVLYQSHERQLVSGEQALTSGEDIFPFPVSWLPDGRFVYTADGQIKLRALGSSSFETIPFAAAFTLQRPVVETRSRALDDPAPQTAVGIYSPALSPSGSHIAFAALNDLWVMPIGEAPVRLTDERDTVGTVFWGAHDGRVYFTSDRHGDGRPDLYAADTASGDIERISTTAEAQMIFPAMSPDGTRIAYVDGRDQSLRVHDVATGQSRHVVDQVYGNAMGAPSWSADGSTVAFAEIQAANSRYREGRNMIRTVNVDTGASAFHEPGPLPEQISDRYESGPVWSPDGKWMAFIMRSVLHVLPVTENGTPTSPARQLSEFAADMPSWGADSRSIVYLASGKLRIAQVDGSGDEQVALDLQWQRQAAQGTSHILAGALWDGVNPALQRNLVIVLEDSRITAIVPAGNNPEADARAAGARFIDASELTVMPGLWDSHIHPRVLDLTAKWWGVTLSYGITTGLSNGGSPYHSLEIHEAIESGQLLGPRMLPSPLFDGQRPYYGHHRSVHDAQALALELDKAQALGMHFYKVYVRAPISYMQETARFAGALGLPSGSHFLSPGIQSGISAATHLSASQRMGYSWAESPQGNSYQDVMTLFMQGDFNLSSHHTSRNNILGDDPGILDDLRFRTLMPVNYQEQIIREASTAPTQAQWQAVRDSLATPAAIAAGGGLVTIGSDTPLSWPALALHAQLRAYAAVVGNHAALQAVTLNAARYAKVDRDLGSIEVGKIADMLLVRGNPLEDVRHAADIELIIKNGVGITVDDILARYR